VHLLLFLSFGGAACLVVFALAAMLLLPPTVALPGGAMAEEEPPALVAEVTELAAVPEPPAIHPVVTEPAPLPDGPAPEAPLPDVPPTTEVAEANINPPPLPDERRAATVPPADHPKPAVKPEPPAQEKSKKGAACVKFGTRIAFLPHPPDAFKKAKDENKQVFFVHLSGNFEDQEFT
jgi:hypothetical protein